MAVSGHILSFKFNKDFHIVTEKRQWRKCNELPSWVPFWWRKYIEVPSSGENVIKCPLKGPYLTSGENVIKCPLGSITIGENMNNCPLGYLTSGENVMRYLLGCLWRKGEAVPSRMPCMLEN